jgi:hypothetical protein
LYTNNKVISFYIQLEINQNIINSITVEFVRE